MGFVERDANYRHVPPDGFGEVLRAARLARGWSLRVAGRRHGLSFGYLGQLERGTRAPSVSVARLLVEVLGLEGVPAGVVRSAAVPGVGRDYPGRVNRGIRHGFGAGSVRHGLAGFGRVP